LTGETPGTSAKSGMLLMTVVAIALIHILEFLHRPWEFGNA
jgi:hypothetical protein